VPDRVNWAASIWLVVSSQKLFQLNLRLETNHSIASLADKKNFFLVPKMFQLFLPNFGALTSKLQSIFLYQV